MHIYRFQKKNRHVICKPMQKCMNDESSTTMSLSVDTVTVNLSPSSQSSPSHYSTLQFNYNREHNVPSNNIMPLYNRLDRNIDSFTSSSSCLEMHLHHSTASSNDDVNSNGYVLSDDFRRESHIHTIRRNFSTDTQLKSEDKTNKLTHKTAVILKSDGTGIIRTGTLQALIPSSRSDEKYTVTPSQTHESYFDVKVHS